MIHLFLGNIPWKPKMKLAHIIMICNWPSTDDATLTFFGGSFVPFSELVQPLMEGVVGLS